MNKDFLKPNSSNEQIPPKLFEDTKDILFISFNPKRTIAKFYFLQVVGMFLTLFICPQYGFYSEGKYLVTEMIMDYGSVFCGFFCSSFFFLGGLVLVSIFMKQAELKWVVRKELALIIPFILLIFFVMVSSKGMAVPNDLHFDSFHFDLVWLTTAFIVMYFGLKIGQSIPRIWQSLKFDS